MEVETSLLLGVIFLLILLVLTFFGFLVYSGLLSDINIGTKNNPLSKLTVAYKFARGPYKNAGDLFTEVHALTPDLKCIGIYYDCPDEVLPQRLRYVVGAILSEGDNEVNEEQKTLLVNRGYKVTTFPAVSHAVVTSFPFVNTFSVFIAIIKVYPKINQYIAERSLSAHPMMEIYEKGLIYFVAPLARQDEFYVPESLEEDDDGEDSVVSTAHSDGDESVITDTEPTHQGTQQVELSQEESQEESAEESDEEGSVEKEDSASEPEPLQREESPQEVGSSGHAERNSPEPSHEESVESAKLSGHSNKDSDSESMHKEAGPGVSSQENDSCTKPLEKSDNDPEPTLQSTEHEDLPKDTEQPGHLCEDDNTTRNLEVTQQIEEAANTTPTDGVVTEKSPEEVLCPSEEKGESSAAAANTSEEETSQTGGSRVAEQPEGDKLEAEGRSSEQADDDSSASSSFEELTLDATESDPNDKKTS